MMSHSKTISIKKTVNEYYRITLPVEVRPDNGFPEYGYMFEKQGKLYLSFVEIHGSKKFKFNVNNNYSTHINIMKSFAEGVKSITLTLFDDFIEVKKCTQTE